MLYDIAIVGGGITGALLAYTFMQRGLSCLMLERGRVGQGSTRLSTALLQYEIDTHMGELAFRYGDHVALQAYAGTRKSLQQLEALTKELPEGVRFRLRESLYLASKEDDFIELLDENLYREDHGFESLIINQKELANRYGIDASGALLNPYAGQMEAGAFTQLLLQKLVGEGLTLLEDTAAEKIEKSNGAFSIQTKSGSLQAEHLVMAAGYEALKYLDMEALGVTVNRTYVVQGHCSELRGRGNDFPLVWETARPYFYARTLNDHGDIILGGGDVAITEAPKEDNLLAVKQAELESTFKHYFPNFTFQNATAKSGVFVESEDGLPVLAPLNGLDGAYALVGCGGNGILFALWAARCLADVYEKGISSQLSILLPERARRFGQKTTAGTQL